MDKSEKKLIKDIYKDYKKLNNEQIRLIFRYYIEAYFDAYINNNIYDLANINSIWYSFKMINSEEKWLYNFVINNYKNIDLKSGYDFFDMLDNINDKTVEYIIDSLCGIKKDKNFYTLIETDFYRMYAQGLLMSLDNIKEFLGYEEDFWKYVESKTAYLDSYLEKSKDFYGVLINTDDDDNIKDIRVYVPIIVDLFTALVNVHEFKHAHDLYQSIGKKYGSEEEYEKSARNLEVEFQKKYMFNRINK